MKYIYIYIFFAESKTIVTVFSHHAVNLYFHISRHDKSHNEMLPNVINKAKRGKTYYKIM